MKEASLASTMLQGEEASSVFTTLQVLCGARPTTPGWEGSGLETVALLGVTG